MERLVRKRRPLVASLLTFLGPGLGQIYNGSPKKAAAFYLLGYALIFALVAGFRAAPLNTAELILALLALFYLVVLVDAFRSARARGVMALRPYQRWYVYLALAAVSLIPSNLVADFLRENVLEAFSCPASSMEPTLRVGDLFIVDKSAYRSRPPARGDVVVLNLPNEPRKMAEQPELKVVKRVVAVAGDVVEIKEAKLLLNGAPLDEPFAQWRLGGRKDYPAVTVPPGRLFLLGDNRDHSKDSRYWPEPFPTVEQVVGKALLVYAPWERMGTEIR